MITTLIPVLAAAKQRQYAVGAFNVTNLELATAVIEAAEESCSPVIVQISEAGWSYGGAGLLPAVLALAQKTAVPVVIHLDHGRNRDNLEKAATSGFSSLMVDASSHTYNENVRLTSEVARLAHRKRLSVEGELGTFGGSEDGVKQVIIYPNADDVAAFAKKTKVDALAVGLGTAHGLPVVNEHVELDLLESIVSKTAVPIVLHGASNLPAATIRAAIARGVCKINIDTELRQAFTAATREALRRDPAGFDPRVYLGAAREAVKKQVMLKMKLFGSINKATHAHARRR